MPPQKPERYVVYWTDAEQLRIVRGRLHLVEKAILDYLDAIEASGTERQAAWEAFQEASVGHMTAQLFAFAEVYQRTMPARQAAAEALQAALTTDWRTEILCAGDMTDKQRAEWLSKSAETGEELNDGNL